MTKRTVIFFIQKEKSMMHVFFCYHANVKRHAVLIFVSEWISPLCAVLHALVYMYRLLTVFSQYKVYFFSTQ